MKEIVYSTGIDIGTSTTNLVFSRLTIENRASSYVVPNISIVDKTVVYRSEIYTTPLLSETEIDAEGIKNIVKSEFDRAGFEPKDIDAGAIIITGEMARKHNADLVLSSISELAGDFVVATAGPALEAVLSAKGAGTDQISKDKLQVIANIDVGGGTSNIAVFDRGILSAVACLDIGGRLIHVENDKISFIAPPIQQLAKRYNIPIQVGAKADRSLLKSICEKMAGAIFAAVNLFESQPGELEELSTNQAELLPKSIQLEGLTLSGGVADCLYYPKDTDDFRYGDVGPILAREILDHPAMKKIKIYPVIETIRATVVGAGSHTVEVSGSTISYAEELLPIKNIPLLHIPLEDEMDLSELESSIKRKMSLFMPEGIQEKVAISFSGDYYTNFLDIQKLADTLISSLDQLIKAKLPVIIVLMNDIGKILGHSLNVKLKGQVPVLCIDDINAINGDYIDVGKPFAEGRVVPVVIKTLVFNTART